MELLFDEDEIDLDETKKFMARQGSRKGQKKKVVKKETTPQLGAANNAATL
jgi:hypothetical protein